MTSYGLSCFEVFRKFERTDCLAPDHHLEILGGGLDFTLAENWHDRLVTVLQPSGLVSA